MQFSVAFTRKIEHVPVKRTGNYSWHLRQRQIERYYPIYFAFPKHDIDKRFCQPSLNTPKVRMDFGINTGWLTIMHIHKFDTGILG